MAAVSDIDPKRIRKARKTVPSIQGFTNYQEMLGRVDAVSICTPTETHCEVAEFFLENQIPALVEKPIASNLTEAQKIFWASHGTSTQLHIGHIERFNPAVIRAKELVRRPIFIEAVRFGQFDPRVQGIGVILDLMIHDLDLVLWLLSDLDVVLEEYTGQGLSLLGPHEDLVKVRLKFRQRHLNHPVIVDLTANRLSMERFRKIRIFQEDSYLSMDLLNRKLKYSRVAKPPLRHPRDLVTAQPRLASINPLKKELEHFLNSVVKSAGSHDVHPMEAWDALELALQLNQTIERKNLYAPPGRSRPLAAAP